ncbi:MAG: hypothetical protein IKO03_07555 [Lachnospiraceae bacterium]|jgi:hypothetical protein|nr:hypothetical protein [Lachnospiraceae bacterium]MBR3508602.1 hypothetical protein [Lachnospiraceae bacterium]MBR4606224.1 hypothetical protein [Lachnospiraceae bacterium]MBR6151004.1 hypothetical protein [Lachnospiraceae bacterium]
MKELILALLVGFVIFLVIRILCGVIAVGFYAGGHNMKKWFWHGFSHAGIAFWLKRPEENTDFEIPDWAKDD